MKKKLLIGLGVVLGVFVVAVAIGVANLGKIVDSQKPRILAELKKQTGRDITIGDVGVSLWPSIGVRVDDVVVSDDPAFSSEPFLRCENVVISVKIRPLLSRRVEVGRLIVNRPEVVLTRDASGRFNFDSMVEASGNGAAETVSGGGGVRGVGDSEKAAAALPLVLAYADIKEGTVRFSDAMSGTELTIRNLNAKAENVSTDREVSFHLDAALFSDETDVRIDGRVGPIGEFTEPADLVDVAVNVELSVGPIPVEKLERYAPDPSAMQPLEPLSLGDVQLKVKLTGTLGALLVENLVVAVNALKSKEPNLLLTMNIGPLNVVDAQDLDVKSIPASGTIKFDPIPLAEVRRVVATTGAVPGLNIDGTASLEASLSGTSGALEVVVEFDATGANIVIKDKFTKSGGVPLRANATLGFSGGRIDVKKSLFTLNNLKLSATGFVEPNPLGPAADITIDVAETDIAGWKDLLPALAPFKPTGSFAGSVRVRMTPGSEKPNLSGEIVVTDGGATVEGLLSPIRNAGARITFEGAGARVTEGSLTIGETTFNAEATIAQVDPMEARFQVTSAEIRRTDFNTPPKPSPRPEVFRNVRIEGTLRQSSNGVISIAADANSPQGIVSNIEYTDLRATLSGTPEQIAIERFSLRVLGGTMTGKGTFEPIAEPPKFDVVTQVRQINLVEYFAYKFPNLPKFIEGKMDLDLNVNGKGRTWDEVQPTLAGGGAALVVRGALLNINVARELLDGIQRLPLVPANFGDNMRSRYRNLFASDKTLFEDLKGDLTIENGRVKIRSVLMKTNDFTVSGEGWFSFDRTLDMSTTFVFNNKLTADILAQIPQAKYLLRADGLLELPLRISGDAVKPKLGLDTEAVTARLQKGLVEGSVDDLKGKLKGFLGGIGKKKKN